MTPEEVQAVADVVEIAIGRRMEEVYGELEAVKEQVREAIEHVRATAEVLHDNDTALMAHLQAGSGGEAAGLVIQVSESWERFLKSEMARLGWKVQVPK